MGEDFYCGAGKSTLMKFLLGLLPCQTGEIHVSGTQVSKENLARVRRTMGYALQDSDNQMCMPAYSSVDGVLFNANQTLLHTYPAGKSSASYSIPASVTDIGDSAFFNCGNLTSVTIPDSVTVIGAGAFSKCDNLKDVYYGVKESQWGQIGVSRMYNNSLTNATIHYNSAMPTTPAEPEPPAAAR